MKGKMDAASPCGRGKEKRGMEECQIQRRCRAEKIDSHACRVTDLDDGTIDEAALYDSLGEIILPGWGRSCTGGSDSRPSPGEVTSSAAEASCWVMRIERGGPREQLRVRRSARGGCGVGRKGARA